MIQLYTGNGKGKTTAALGLLLRALGQGQKVALIQFMKKGDFGEIKALRRFENVLVRQFGRRSFVTFKRPTKEDISEAKKAIKTARDIIRSREYDLVVLDEINVALKYRLINPEDLLNIVQDKSLSTELVLTGRFAHDRILKQADLVTEMREIKHYFRKGLAARKGIEY